MPSLGYRAPVSQSEALVRGDQSVAAVQASAGTVDAYPFHGVYLDAIAGLKLWESFPLMELAPWRKGVIITAGLFGQWLKIQFIGLRIRDACDSKPENFAMSFPNQDQRLQR